MRRHLFALFIGAGLVTRAFCQLGVQYPETSPQRGIPPMGAYDFSKFETVNKANGNLIYTIPLTSMPIGRAGMSISVNLVYNSSQYDYSYSLSNSTLYPYPAYVTQSLLNDLFGGWSISPGYSLLSESKPLSTGNSCGVFLGVERTSLVMPDGSRHVLTFPGFPHGFEGNGDGYSIWSYSGGALCVGYPNLPSPVTMFTTDGSYIKVVATADGSWTAYLPDGTTVSNPIGAAAPQTIADRNGNKINISLGQSGTVLTDDEGRTITIAGAPSGTGWTVTQAGFGGTPLTWTFGPASSSAPAAFTFWYDCQNAQSIEGVNIGPNVCQTTGSGGGTDMLQVPSGNPNQPLTYTFQYGALSGLLQTVTLPSGASATYSYQCNNYPSCFNVRSDLLNPVVGKTVSWTDQSDGGSVTRTEPWSYTYGSPSSFSRTAPDGGVETTYLGGGPQSSVPVKVTEPNGDSIDYYYQLNRPYGVAFGSPNPYLAAEVHNLTVNGTPAVSAVTLFQTDKNGNQLSAASYDWSVYSKTQRDANGIFASMPIAAGTLLRQVNNAFTVTTIQKAGTGSEKISDDANAYWNPASSPLLHLLASSTTAGAGTGAVSGYRYDSMGNQTQEAHWDSTKAAAAPAAASLTIANASVTTRTFDQYGEILTEADPNGNVTNYAYNGWPTFISKAEASQAPISLTTAYIFDYSTGLVLGQQDLTNQVTTWFGRDAMGRLTSTMQSLGGEGAALRTTTITYDDTNRRVITAKDQNTPNDAAIVSVVDYDQLYRITGARQLETAGQNPEDPTVGIKVQTRYMFGPQGDFTLVSNPFRAATSGAAAAEPTMGWTLTSHDLNGRTVSVQTFAGATTPAPFGGNGSSTGTTTTAYSGQNTTVTDQAGHGRQTVVDGLGRLARVIEDPVTLKLLTGYTYL